MDQNLHALINILSHNRITYIVILALKSHYSGDLALITCGLISLPDISSCQFPSLYCYYSFPLHNFIRHPIFINPVFLIAQLLHNFPVFLWNTDSSSLLIIVQFYGVNNTSTTFNLEKHFLQVPFKPTVPLLIQICFCFLSFILLFIQVPALALILLYPCLKNKCDLLSSSQQIRATPFLSQRKQFNHLFLQKMQVSQAWSIFSKCT